MYYLDLGAGSEHPSKYLARSSVGAGSDPSQTRASWPSITLKATRTHTRGPREPECTCWCWCWGWGCAAALRLVLDMRRRESAIGDHACASSRCSDERRCARRASCAQRLVRRCRYFRRWLSSRSNLCQRRPCRRHSPSRTSTRRHPSSCCRSLLPFIPKLCVGW